VFLGRVGVALGVEHAQGGDEFGARVARLDDGVDPAAFGGDVGIGEALAEFLNLLPAEFIRFRGLLNLAAINDPCLPIFENPEP